MSVFATLGGTPTEHLIGYEFHDDVYYHDLNWVRDSAFP
jgi:hypothetical protein